jgi:hypothetical protein
MEINTLSSLFGSEDLAEILLCKTESQDLHSNIHVVVTGLQKEQIARDFGQSQ